MTPDSFKNRFPVFASETDARIQSLIDQSDAYFDRCKWGQFYEDGVAYWMAHRLVMDNAMTAQLNPSGFLADGKTGASVGDVSYTKDSLFYNAAAKNTYLKTQFGQEYYRLLKLIGQGMVAV